METATKIPWRKPRAEMSDAELRAKRAYDARKARESRAHRRAQNDAQQAQSARQHAGELPAALGMKWGVGNIGERCSTASELLQSAREFAQFLKPDDPEHPWHPATLECRDARLGEPISEYVELIEKIWCMTGRRVMDRISFRDLDAVPHDEETTIDYLVVGDECVSYLPKVEPYAVRESDFPNFIRFMSESD